MKIHLVSLTQIKPGYLIIFADGRSQLLERGRVIKKTKSKKTKSRSLDRDQSIQVFPLKGKAVHRSVKHVRYERPTTASESEDSMEDYE